MIQSAVFVHITGHWPRMLLFIRPSFAFSFSASPFATVLHHFSPCSLAFSFVQLAVAIFIELLEHRFAIESRASGSHRFTCCLAFGFAQFTIAILIELFEDRSQLLLLFLRSELFPDVR